MTFENVPGLYEKRKKEWRSRLKPFGKVLDKLHLIQYDFIFDEIYPTLEFYTTPVICFFKGHDYHWFFRTPVGDERAYTDNCGMMRKSGRECMRCWKPEFGIKVE